MTIIEMHEGDRPCDSEAIIMGHYLKHRETVYVPSPVDALIVPLPTFWQRRQAKRRRSITLLLVALGSGLIGWAWGARIIFALLVGQIP